jgi:outer membrane receptor protein involved in Fe transport
MLGGELALSWRIDEDFAAYARVARGYKAGGFNVSFAGVDFDQVDNVSPEQIEFDAESLLSLEAGVKGTWLDGRLTGDFGIFESRRDDQQIKIPMQLTLGDPSSFLFLTENAEEARHRGLEASAEWRATDALTLSAALGFLDTQVERFLLYPALEGREQAHAPNRSFALAAEYHAENGWWGRVDLAGRDSFYFDYGHDQKSDDYALVNMSIGRRWGPWSATMWARNLLDEKYAVRGFFFGNEPPDFPETLYTRLGDPRHIGLTLKYSL